MVRDALDAPCGAVVIQDPCSGAGPAAPEAAWAELANKGVRI
jgi:hypothetical protein